MDTVGFRDHLPYLKKDKIYLNHASIAPLPDIIINRAEEYLRLRSSDNIDGFNLVEETISKGKENIANMLNASADRIAVIDNTSNGLNILAQGIRWERGDKIVIGGMEFPSNVYPFLNLEDQGVVVQLVGKDEDFVSAEDLLEAATPDTRLISVSFVQFLSGYRIDLEKLGAECRKRGIILCVDAIQGLGALQLDVQKCNIDFLSCGTQKWLFGMMGLGFTYITGELQNEIKQPFVGWNSVIDAWDLLDYNLTLKKEADAFHTGSPSISSLYCWNGVTDALAKIGGETIEKQTVDNAKYLSAGLQESGLRTLLRELPEERFAGIVTFPHDNAEEIHKKLLEKNIHCSLREGNIRLSPHFYNTKEELDKAVEDIIKMI